MSPEGQRLIGTLGLRAIKDAKWTAAAVGGLTLGADPIAYAICHTSAEDKQPLRSFTVRKEPKGHGTGKQVEGPVASGDRVVVVEDVITTGGSASKAVEVLKREGIIPVGILALVDRQEGGRETLEQLGLTVVSLTTAAEIVPHLA